MQFSFPLNIAWQIISEIGLVYILDLKKKQFFYFQDVGADIWHLISQNYCLESIITEISDKYETDAAEVRADVQDFIQQLMSLELVVANGGSERA